MALPRFRTGGPDDAGAVALLHADSWRRTYRGVYADSYLDDDLAAERTAVWSARLAAPGDSLTLLAEDGTGPVGFVHVVFGEDQRWGSLVDNLHVAHERRRRGIGAALLTRAAGAVAERAPGSPLYLWVQARNSAAQGFYTALGGRNVGTALVAPPGGRPERLHGAPEKYRFAWPDAAALGRAADG
jgi:ribosomal protein S18 acetylase RimI-like enzyme